MVRLGLLSFWHVHAKDYLADAAHHPDTEVVTVWDEDVERGQTEAQVRGLPFYENLDDLLAEPAIDGVIVTTPTNLHETVMVAAAAAGKHIFTEKVLADTTTSAIKILKAAEDYAVKLCVSLPRLYHGSTQAIKDMISRGELGTVSYARVRLAHDGALSTAAHPEGWLPQRFYDVEQARGGALIDLGCHPVYLLHTFLGRPRSVQATFGYLTRRAVEDQAVVTFGYADGAIGIAETGFVSTPGPIQIEVHGTVGRLQYGWDEAQIRVQKQGASTWANIDIPDDLPTPFELWIAQIQNGVDGSENLSQAYALTKAMEVAYASASQNCTILLGS